MIQLGLPWLMLLTPLPLLLPWILPPVRQTEAPLFGPVLAERALVPQDGSRRLPVRRTRLLFLLLIWVLLLLAASQPRWIGDPVALPVAGRDLMLAVDISESMLQEDMAGNREPISRLQAVKRVLGDFVQRREGDRIGLILFGSQAYLQTPLTFDRDTLYRLLLEARSGFAGPRTAIGDAIGIAIKRLRDRPADARVLILLTDGANTAGAVEPLQAAAMAAEEGLRVHTIGVGADEMIQPGLFGSRLGARRINPSADLDEQSLQQISELTGGRYFRARDPQELQQIYATLDELEPTQQDPELLRPERSLLHWPLAAALLCIALLAASLHAGARWRSPGAGGRLA